MRPIMLLPAAFMVAAGCFAFGGADHEALDKELAGMLKSYRQCLEKHEDDAIQRKEKCEVYRKTVYDLAPKDLTDRKGRPPEKEKS